MRKYETIAERIIFPAGKEVRVRLEIDSEKLLRWLGENAASNASGTSYRCRGYVRARVVKR